MCTQVLCKSHKLLPSEPSLQFSKACFLILMMCYITMLIILTSAILWKAMKITDFMTSMLSLIHCLRTAATIVFRPFPFLSCPLYTLLLGKAILYLYCKHFQVYILVHISLPGSRVIYTFVSNSYSWLFEKYLKFPCLGPVRISSIFSLFSRKYFLY